MLMALCNQEPQPRDLHMQCAVWMNAIWWLLSGFTWAAPAGLQHGAWAAYSHPLQEMLSHEVTALVPGLLLPVSCRRAYLHAHVGMCNGWHGCVPAKHLKMSMSAGHE